MYDQEREKKEKRPSFLENIFRKRTKRLLTDIDRLFSKIMWMEILSSVLLICFGVLFLLNPGVSAKTVGVIFGLIILFYGASTLYAYFKKDNFSFFRYHLIFGIVEIGIGILTFLNPFLLSQVVTFFIGVWLIYKSCEKFEMAWFLYKIEEKSFLFLLLSGVLEVFMSLVIFMNPFSNLAITQLAGAYFILTGIVNATDAVLTKNRAIDFLENL